MRISENITRLPRAFDSDRGDEALQSVPWATGDIAQLVQGAGGSSPYLNGLIQREGQWLETAFDDTEGALKSLSADLMATDAADLPSALRQGKRRVAALAALADLAGAWSLEKVTGCLTNYADLACQVALRAAVAHEIRRGKLPGMNEDNIANAGGMAVFAMGKMGAGELNYSSDIDLICLFNETLFDPDDFYDARSAFVRATRKMAATLNDLTGEGYVFRTDLRLRPDPSVTPVCLAMVAAERYYESVGRTWERAAWIKARPCAGDLAAGAKFQSTLRPFVWRKHLDFAAIEDAHNMRLAIREHKGLGGPITLPKHNMKLGRGGIREIEFFTQTRQLIAGGRDPDLRVRDTVGGLQQLAAKGWVPEEAAQVLTERYRQHREVEHRLQMIHDAQTHDLPGSDAGFDRLAALMGEDVSTLRKDLRTRLEEVHNLTESFFAPDAPIEPQETMLVDEDVTKRWKTYPALRSERAVALFDRLRPDILSRLAQTAKPEEALRAFDGFLEGLPAGVQVFSLFDANPQLIDLLIDIVGTSPDLARYLSRNASVFDAVIGGAFFDSWPGLALLTQELSDVLGRETDYERKLDATRRWGKEWHFRVGVHLLRGLIDAQEAGQQYADLAEATLSALFPQVQAEFALKHGDPPGRGAVILGMGSLGARRLHARSDLDVIMIYDPLEVEASDGRRPLPSRTYYARLTQALITAMTAPMAEGKLYEIDMRLRPSGNQGPVATSFSSFRSYQSENAWVWEHLALTRARVVAGQPELAKDVEAFRQSILAQPRDQGDILGEVAKMRARIQSAKGTAHDWDPKLGAGRMQDIELTAQAGLLLAGDVTRDIETGLEKAAQLGWMSNDTANDLKETYRLCWTLQIGARLISEQVFDPEELGVGGCAYIGRLTNSPNINSLQRDLLERTRQAAAQLDEVLPEVRKDDTD